MRCISLVLCACWVSGCQGSAPAPGPSPSPTPPAATPTALALPPAPPATTPPAPTLSPVPGAAVAPAAATPPAARPAFSALRLGAAWRLQSTFRDLNESTDTPGFVEFRVAEDVSAEGGARQIRWRIRGEGLDQIPARATIDGNTLRIGPHSTDPQGCVSNSGDGYNWRLCFEPTGVPREIAFNTTADELTCTRPVPIGLPVRSYQASRFLEEGRTKHEARRAFDGMLRTAWTVRDPVDGDWVEGCLPRSNRIGRVWLTTGYEVPDARPGDLFVLNAHVRHATVELREGGNVVTSRSVEVGAGERSMEVEFDDVTASCVRVVSHTVWPGQRWQDLCVSEISVIGSPAVAIP